MANITVSGLILDWEGFRMAPRGWDAALLYAYALATPATADRIHPALADVLDTEAGHQALLVVAADLLQSVSRREHPQLAGPLRELIMALP